MYSGALLATAARLAWDPSTYTWFRFLCAAQYRVSAAYVLVAGLWLAALVYVAAAATAQADQQQRASRHPHRLHNTTCLHLVSRVRRHPLDHVMIIWNLYSRFRVFGSDNNVVFVKNKIKMIRATPSSNFLDSVLHKVAATTCCQYNTLFSPTYEST